MILSESRVFKSGVDTHINNRRRWSVTVNYDLPSQLGVTLIHLRLHEWKTIFHSMPILYRVYMQKSRTIFNVVMCVLFKA